MELVEKACVEDVFEVVRSHIYPDLHGSDDEVLISTQDIYDSLASRWSTREIDKALHRLVEAERVGELSPKRWDVLVSDEELDAIALDPSRLFVDPAHPEVRLEEQGSDAGDRQQH